MIFTKVLELSFLLIVITCLNCKREEVNSRDKIGAKNEVSTTNKKTINTEVSTVKKIINNTEEDWVNVVSVLTMESPFRDSGDGIFIYFMKGGILYSKGFNNSDKERQEGYWRVDKTEKSIYLHVKDIDGKDYVNEKYYSFIVTKYDDQISGLIFSKEKNFEEQDDAGVFLSNNKYLTLTAVKHFGPK